MDRLVIEVVDGDDVEVTKEARREIRPAALSQAHRRHQLGVQRRGGGEGFWFVCLFVPIRFSFILCAFSFFCVCSYFSLFVSLFLSLSLPGCLSLSDPPSLSMFSSICLQAK